MNDDLHNYIRQAKDDGDDHQTIRDRLVDAGWHPTAVNNALDKHSPAPEPPSSDVSELPTDPTESQNPIGVVQVFSTRGVEYYLMLITLAVSTLALGALLSSIAEALLGDGGSSFDTGIMALTSAALLASFPLFAFFFLRLKKAELANPRLRLDPSRRRMVQIALIVSFIVGLITVIGYLFAFLNASYGSSYELGDADLLIAEMVITLSLVGGIFAYFWIDTHPKGER